MKSKKSNAISFKTATIIVVSLHLLAFLIFTQLSSYKFKMAKQSHAKKIELKLGSSVLDKQQEWPTNKKLKVVATPPITYNKPTNTIAAPVSTKPQKNQPPQTQRLNVVATKPKSKPITVKPKEQNSNIIYSRTVTNRQEVNNVIPNPLKRNNNTKTETFHTQVVNSYIVLK